MSQQTQELTTRPSDESAVAKIDPSVVSIDVQRVVQQTIAVQKLMESVLHEGEHYGAIPGVKVKPNEKPKKVLMKSGAEKLCLLFRLRPEYEVLARREESTFISFEIRCRLYHIPTGAVMGEGIGSINSRESKYHNQTCSKLCPACNAPAIIKGKPEYGGGWLCYEKKGGCGAKYLIDDKSITDQTSGQPTEARVWELHNTLIKMGQKRALVAATLIATAASDVFTQDLDELETAAEEKREAPKAQQKASQPPAQKQEDAKSSEKAPSQPPAEPIAQKASPEKIEALCAVMKQLGLTARGKVLAWVNDKIKPRTVQSRLDLTTAEADLCIKAADEELSKINDSKKE